MAYFENPKVIFEASCLFHAVQHWTMDGASKFHTELQNNSALVYLRTNTPLLLSSKYWQHTGGPWSTVTVWPEDPICSGSLRFFFLINCQHFNSRRQNANIQNSGFA